MSDLRWDEYCPHCEKHIKEMHDYLAANEPETQFTMECPHCGLPIDVLVEFVPEFGLSKPDTAQAEAAEGELR